MDIKEYDNIIIQYHMDVNKLLKALDDESNENLFNFTTKKILEMNLQVLKVKFL